MAEIIASTYEVIERIGSGGGGIVYLANHLRLNKKVVLKADKRKLTTRPEILRREVDALKDLSHTYIPQVYDFFVEGETVYTVMDFIEGESLDRPLKREEVFSQPQVIEWACELLEALDYLHSPTHGTPPRGIVHSDIKPANIMLTPQGHICLIDFNIALALGEENVVGRSAGYASPEHYGLDFSTDTPIINYETEVMETDDGTVPMQQSESSSSSKRLVVPDARSDIYSLGATLYHLLSGIRPAKDAVDVEPLSKTEFSPLVVDIISKAMNPNPDLRYQSAEEMLYAFRHLRENDPRTKRRKRNCIIISSVLTATLLTGAFTSFVGLKRMEANQRMLTLAEYAQNALDNGDPGLAVEYALSALPERNSLFVPPYTAEAKKALADAMGVYDLEDGYKSNNMVKLPSETFKTALSPDGKTGAAIYAFEVAVFNTETGEILATLPTVKSALADVVFVDNTTILYAGENGVSAYDILNKSELWTGKPATSIAVSADGHTVATVYRDEDFALVYGIDGTEKAAVSFEGKKQRVASNDTFADPGDNLLALSHDGQFLGVSFENGGLYVYDTTDPENSVELYDESDYFHFEGGFYGQYFAFSSTKDGESIFAVIDMEEFVMTGGLDSVSRFGVHADETGVYLSNEGILVNIHPVTGEQRELAYTTMPIRSFSTDGKNTVVVTENNDCFFFDGNAKIVTQYDFGQNSCDFAAIAGKFAVLGGRDTPELKLLKLDEHSDADIFEYDSSYVHDEARINADGTRVMLFDYRGFRLYDMEGKLIKEVQIPEAEQIYDQQYHKGSGNLVVLYKNALRIYSGDDGDLVFEETGLKAVSYAPYGISILRADGTLLLVDAGTAQTEEKGTVQGEFAAWCGLVVDDALLAGGGFIGSGKTADGYYFAIEHGDSCTVYNGSGKELFTAPVSQQSEAFFIGNSIVLSPMHGTPTVYNLSTGKKTADLDKDSYLTYITDLDDYIVSEYISADGKRYGMLLDKVGFDPLARLNGLTDILNGELIFDSQKGTLRKTRIYSIDELISLAKGGDDT